jgi:pentatricopeptide repeat protein
MHSKGERESQTNLRWKILLTPSTLSLRICHKEFMQGAALHMQPAAAVSFLRLLPRRYHNVKLYNLALQACASGRDLAHALEILDLLDALRVKKDAKLLTSMVNVCASVGNAERAFKFFADIKQEYPQQVDGRVYGSVVAACAEAMLREVSVIHERKDQYVLLERAFQVVSDAEKRSVDLEIPVYNSLLVCAGRSGQIGRAFEVLDMMLARGLRPDALTHGSLIEACVQAKRKDLALKIFYGALQRGFGDKVEIYTAAISACKIEGSVDLAKALEIHTLLDVSSHTSTTSLPTCCFHTCIILLTRFSLHDSELPSSRIRSSTRPLQRLRARLGAWMSPLRPCRTMWPRACPLAPPWPTPCCMPPRVTWG